VNLGLGSAKATLLFGGKAADNTVYARDASKTSVVTVESALLEDMKKSADEYRRRTSSSSALHATHIEITRNGQTITLERTKGQGDNAPDTWKRVSPAAGDLDKEKSDGLLGKLSNIRAFVVRRRDRQDRPRQAGDDRGRESSTTEEGGSGDVRQVGTDVFVSRPGEPGAAKIDSADFNDVNEVAG